MSAEACTLTVGDLDELREALSDQREAIVRILTEADAARNGVGVSWEMMLEAAGRLATAVTTIDDTLDHRSGESKAGTKGANDG